MKRVPWYRRPTVRRLRGEAEGDADREFTRKWDERENNETRLPDSETIHLGGVVLAEAFTPSTVSALYRSLERWPAARGDRKQERLEQLARSRSGEGGGWQSLGVVRPPGAFLMMGGHHDQDLPSGVDAVWLHVSYVTPALAMVVATFTLTEEAGDLSGLLRDDYRTKHFDVWIRVYGRLGGLRARIPWSRPRRHASGHRIGSPEHQKAEACRRLMRQHEDACGLWFATKFPGRFAAAAPGRRPVIRMLFTTEHVPYAGRPAWLQPVGLDSALPLWRSTEPEGWWLSEDRWSGERDGRRILTLSAKRADAAEPPGGGESGESNWYLTQRFGTDQAPLAARHAMTALLSLYADRLGALRDNAGIRRRLRRPVREARALDNYLIRDGLDAATVTSDLAVFTDDLSRFRRGVPEFTEHREGLPDPPHGYKLVDYVPALCAAIRRQSARLATDTTATTSNIRASAELRQSITNTRLQRLIVLLSVAATIIAVVSLLGGGH